MSEPLEVTISHLNDYAYGVAVLKNRKFLVPGVLIGEQVLILPHTTRGENSYADLVQILKPSSARISPTCEYFGRCGGCHLQMMSQDDQAKFKMATVTRLLERFDTKILPILSSPQNFNYRNRVTLQSDGKIWGFQKRDSDDVVAIESCAIAEEALNQKLKTFVNTQKPVTKVRHELRSTDEGVSFMQVNTVMNELLLKLVEEWTRESKVKTVLELYAGRANLTVALARVSKKVVACESDAEASHMAIQRLQNLGLGWVKFRHQKSHDALMDAVHEMENFDLVLTDPPRGGMKQALQALIRLSPKYIIYVSCEPHALVRDLQSLCDAGYLVDRVLPLDMFPQTHHVELVVRLSKKS